MSAHIRWGGEHLRGEEYRVVPGCGRGLRRGVGGGLAGDVEAVGTAMGAARKAVRRRARGLGVVGHEVVVVGAAGLGLSGWVVLNHPSDMESPAAMTHRNAVLTPQGRTGS